MLKKSKAAEVDSRPLLFRRPKPACNTRHSRGSTGSAQRYEA